MIKKDSYETPVVEIILFETKDVITTSGDLNFLNDNLNSNEVPIISP